MSNPLHASYYADDAKHIEVRVQEVVLLAQETYRLRFECPEIAETIQPGQFFMVREANSAEPLLGRAFALYDIVHGPNWSAVHGHRFSYRWQIDGTTRQRQGR